MSLKTKRILLSVAGVLISGISVGMMKTAAMGVDPFQALMSGLDALIPVPFGTLYVIVNALLLLFSLLVNRKNIGLATFINLFLLGYVVQFSWDFWQGCFPAPGLGIRLVLFAVGIFILCIGGSMYMTAELGISTYDAVAVELANKWHVAPFRFCRIGTDLVCLALGAGFFLLSGGSWREIPTIIGIGTVLTALCMGPLVDLFNRKVFRPFLEK